MKFFINNCRLLRAGPYKSLLTVLIASVFFMCGCEQRPENVVLISIDTCRPDRIGAYGASGDPTPNIDRVASEGARFQTVLTPVPVTLPAHATMLSGFLPPWHGVHHNAIFVVPEGLPTMATILKKREYETGAVVGSFVLDKKFGLARGFDAYYGQELKPGENGMAGRH